MASYNINSKNSPLKISSGGSTGMASQSDRVKNKDPQVSIHDSKSDDNDGSSREKNGVTISPATDTSIHNPDPEVTGVKVVSAEETQKNENGMDPFYDRSIYTTPNDEGVMIKSPYFDQADDNSIYEKRNHEGVMINSPYHNGAGADEKAENSPAQGSAPSFNAFDPYGNLNMLINPDFVKNFAGVNNNTINPNRTTDFFNNTTTDNTGSTGLGNENINDLNNNTRDFNNTGFNNLNLYNNLNLSSTNSQNSNNTTGQNRIVGLINSFCNLLRYVADHQYLDTSIY